MAEAALDMLNRARAFQFLREQTELTARGRGSSGRPFHTPAYFLGVEQRALLVG